MEVDYATNVMSRPNLSSVGEPIRVLRIIARMNIGGPAIQITGLMKDLPRESINQLLVTGFCLDDERDYLFESAPDIPVIRMPGLGRRLNLVSDLRAFLELRKLIRRFNPNIIHTHTAKAGVLGRLASLGLSQTYLHVHTFHGHLLHGYFGKVMTKCVVLIERILAYRTDCLVAVGQKVRDDLLAVGIGSESDYRVIPPGIELRELPSKKQALQQFGLQEHDFTVSWVGRMTTVKAPLRVVELARYAKKLDLNIRFIMVGDGELRRSLDHIIHKEKLPIHLLGWQNDIEHVLAFTDLMLLTSLNEGMPISLIEAEMAGVPSLSTNVGAVSEVLIDRVTGRCLDFDVEKFIEIIEEMISNASLRHFFSQQAQQHALSKFSRDRLVHDHLQMYFSLINYKNSSKKRMFG